ncbi:hypothetical protein [Alicyclobacillus sp. SO9]|uniref:hypothetical protein n=1 Tax=Alicyclobacillus sp. SO9 TaxID=2665646 RepID=UPI0018E8E445|nr:hypothetical protein [Alicyclobacillus sp. SO9]QQE81601.1 hypothetical protein GI364_24725 [Alicyclobacillus sp. SO9]
MFGLQKESTNEEVFRLSCELNDTAEEIWGIKAEMERLGLTPKGADISRVKSSRWRKKVLGLIKKSDELVKKGEKIRDRLAELEVPIEK